MSHWCYSSASTDGDMVSGDGWGNNCPELETRADMPGRGYTSAAMDGDEGKMDNPMKCGMCQKTYVREAQVRCAVLHAPGRCCHYGEVEVEVIVRTVSGVSDCTARELGRD